MTAAQPRSEFRLGWKPLAAGVIGVACGASPLPFNTIGFVLAPIHQETGWTFAEISAAITVYGIVAALLAPVFGSLADRHGVRPVALWSTFAFALAFAGVGLGSVSLAMFYVMWFLVGLVGIGSTPVTWSRAVNMWFFRNRGLALGILLLGTSVAALTVPRLAVAAIARFGWHGMYVALALLPLLIALPIAFAWFREPRPEQAPGEAGGDGVLPGVTLRAAVRDRRFWTIWASVFCVALAYGGAHIHMPEIVKQHGFTAAEGAGIMGMIGIALMAGRLITGWLFDRVWAPFVTLPILLVPAFACWWLVGSGTDRTTIYAAAFMLGFAAGAESDVIAYLASRYFGLAHYGKIYGMLYMPFGVASAISPVLYGRVRDTTGVYDGMLEAAIGLFAIGAVLLLTLGRYPRFGSDAAPSDPGLAG